MAKIAIFGGTGMTGQHAVLRALEKGKKNQIINFMFVHCHAIHIIGSL